MASIAEPFVPAWKRLGLKLKSSPSALPSTGTQSIDGDAVPTRSNKRKATAISSEDNFPHVHQNTTPTTPSSKPKKSVSFSAEVKKVDGDIAQNTFQDWASKQKGGEGQFTTSEVAEFIPPPKLHTANQIPTTPSPKPSKKDRKQKSSPVDDSPETTPSYVTYLQKFHRQREQWRFNKATQILLLKNTFNVFRVPEQNDDALKAYLGGLQGQAARERLTQEAYGILNNTNDSTDSPTNTTMTDSTHKDARDAVLKSQLKATKSRLRDQETRANSTSQDHLLLLRKRKRAETVLQGLGATEEDLATRSTKIEENHEPATKKQRTRRPKKLRTGVPDDDLTDDTSSVDSVPSSVDIESGGDSSSEEESDSSSGESSSSDSDEDSDSNSDGSISTSGDKSD